MNETDWQTPDFMKKKNIPHYYGDSVRNMFIASAVIYAIALPLFGSLLPLSVYVGIGIVLLLVFLAGITNPHSQILMFINAGVAGIGVYLMQTAAISGFGVDSTALFVLRQMVVILLLIAFYDAVKTARNMLIGKIGTAPQPGEFSK
ncbi:hypothetical protein K2P56_02375 [Patescibacteria group bacterium]|nr:hypothetical protein [Patescibacteria group bacterium]